MAVGAVLSDGQGSAYLFSKPAEGWITTTQTAKLTASDGELDDSFGWSIALSADTVVVGAPSDQIGADTQRGSAYVFAKPAGNWITTTQTAKLTASDGGASEQFGWSVALSGDKVVVGAPFADIDANAEQGLAYAFVKPANGWMDMTETDKITASDGAADDWFGWSLELEGDMLVVGSALNDIDLNEDQGSAYVFEFVKIFQFFLPMIWK